MDTYIVDIVNVPRCGLLIWAFALVLAGAPYEI